MLHPVGLLLCIVFLATALSGCCPPMEPKPDSDGGAVSGKTIQGEILVSENANPDPYGDPLPVTIRIYQLASDEKFRNAAFPALRDDDEAVLGSDLLFKEEMDAYPGTQVPFERTWDKTVRHLGVMAIFQDREKATWRALMDVPPDDTFPVIVKIEDSSVSLWRKDNGL